MSKSPLNPRDFPEVVDIIPPGALAELGIVMAVPVVEIYRPAVVPFVPGAADPRTR